MKKIENTDTYILLSPNEGEIIEAVARRCSIEKVYFKILQNSQEKICARVSFLNKVVGVRPATLLKKRFWHRYFLVNFAKFLRTRFVTKHLRWLLLKLQRMKFPDHAFTLYNAIFQNSKMKNLNLVNMILLIIKPSLEAELVVDIFLYLY